MEHTGMKNVRIGLPGKCYFFIHYLGPNDMRIKSIWEALFITDAKITGDFLTVDLDENI